MSILRSRDSDFIKSYGINRHQWFRLPPIQAPTNRSLVSINIQLLIVLGSHCTSGRCNYIYALCGKFVNFTQRTPWVWFFFGSLLYIFPVQEWFCHCNWIISTFVLIFFASYNGVCIYMFVYVIQSNCWLYLILVILSYISPMYGLFFHFIFITFAFLLICLWMLYMCLLRYAGVLNMLCPLVVYKLGSFSCIFPAYDLLLYCRHHRWHAFAKVD